MRTTQEKIVQYVGMKFGADIANELQNRVTCVIAPPTYSSVISAHHNTRETMIRAQQRNMKVALEARCNTIAAQIASTPGDIDLPLTLAKVENDIVVLDYEISEPVEVQSTEQERNEYE